ncbi:MAG: GspE/PulE family protein [Puniceicoccaceae bacterium]
MTSADDFVLQLLVDNQVITEETLEIARGDAANSHPEEEEATAALKLLEEHGYVTDEEIIKLLAEAFSMEVVDLTMVNPPEEVLNAIPFETVEAKNVFPIEMDESEIQVAISDPLDVDLTDTIAALTHRTVTPFLATPTALLEKIRESYANIANQVAASVFGDDEDDASLVDGADIEGIDRGSGGADDGPILRYVQHVITDAIKKRASDIHLEPLEKRFRVRFRIDGVLHEMESPPKRLQSSILTRLKLMADISIAEKRVPQDGRIKVKTAVKEIDLRVSSLPTSFGESIVMRILDKEGLQLGLPQLGFFSDDQSVFERVITMADGVFLVTGPTGSGKSTTLYSALNYINRPDTKIITVEDPVEYELAGVNQVQVRRDVGMTFTAALRAMLRQAPNIIMVGEIRDLETAEIAINAALTGHMVFSTLHTNDAPSAVSRLVDIGVKPFLVSAALRAVLAQRLVRRICAKCKQPHTPESWELEALQLTDFDPSTANFSKGAGCAHCNGTGFRGRFGVFEIFAVNEEMAQLIYEGRTLVELRDKARDLGMRSMREDGIRKVLAGMTTADEVIRATVVND